MFPPAGRLVIRPQIVLGGVITSKEEILIAQTLLVNLNINWVLFCNQVGVVMNSERIEWAYWYKQAEAIVDAHTRDKVVNIMLLASELRKQYVSGIAQGVYESDNRER